jgi:hypothetical protein
LELQRRDSPARLTVARLRPFRRRRSAVPACGGVAFAFSFEHHDRAADGRHVAGFAVERDDFAGDGRGHLHRRFIRHHVDERRVFFDDIANAHVPGDDLGFGGAFTHVRKFENELAHWSLAFQSRGAWL